MRRYNDGEKVLIFPKKVMDNTFLYDILDVSYEFGKVISYDIKRDKYLVEDDNGFCHVDSICNYGSVNSYDKVFFISISDYLRLLSDRIAALSSEIFEDERRRSKLYRFFSLINCIMGLKVFDNHLEFKYNESTSSMSDKLDSGEKVLVFPTSKFNEPLTDSVERSVIYDSHKIGKVINSEIGDNGKIVYNVNSNNDSEIITIKGLYAESYSPNEGDYFFLRPYDFLVILQAKLKEIDEKIRPLEERLTGYNDMFLKLYEEALDTKGYLPENVKQYQKSRDNK